MCNVLSIVKSINEIVGEIPCKKTVQKIVYLIKEAGGDLGFDYSIHFYGPYSAELDSEIRYLCDCGELNMDITDHGHMLYANDDLTYPPVNQIAKNVISYFGKKSPSALELLATTLYVQRSIPDADRQDIKDGVVKIKGKKYSHDQIELAINELVEQAYFNIL